MTTGSTGHYKGLKRAVRIPSCRLSKDDLHRLYSILEKKASESVDIEIRTLPRLPEQSEEDWGKMKDDFRDTFRLAVIVHSRNGEQVIGQSKDVLDDDQLPDHITAIAFDADNSFRREGYIIPNRFSLFLDFTEPPWFGQYNPWDVSTPNGSLLDLICKERNWGIAIHNEVLDFFKARKKSRRWLHSALMFNSINWIIGFPAALWLVYRLDSQYADIFSKMHGALRGAIYVYLVLVVLLISRTMVGVFRWLYPIIEIEGARSIGARRFFSALASSPIFMLVYDVIKAFIARMSQ